MENLDPQIPMSRGIGGRIEPSRSFRPVAAAKMLYAANLWIAVSVPAAAFECPRPHDAASPGVLKETREQMEGLTKLLAGGDIGNQVPMIVADLRQRYPAVGTAEVVNYVVSAECPNVAKLTGLSDSEKQSRVDQFSARVWDLTAPQPANHP